ncbi:MAG: 2'-5' RNA ligase family protein [Lewinellaceae bacterium]|nr:2'-5' RNA ligase family protein [Lewinellaceae bacterium]
MHFVAVLPPDSVQEQVNGFKEYIAQTWGPRHAFRSPPHITLLPPFHWPADQLNALKTALLEFSASRNPFDVGLLNFDFFPPGVIFVNPVPNPDLTLLYHELHTRVCTLFDPATFHIARPFHAHMTIAHRDVQPADFPAIRSYFEQQTFQAKFRVNRLTFLSLYAQEWEIDTTFPFQPIEII